MKRIFILFFALIANAVVYSQMQASPISTYINSNADSSSRRNTTTGTIQVEYLKGNVHNRTYWYNYQWGRYDNTRNDGAISRLAHLDASGMWKVSPKDSLKVTPQMLASPVTADKGGTGLSSPGSSGQVLLSTGSGFTMTTPTWISSESDPAWTAASSNYWTKSQSDTRYLQTEVDGNPSNELQSISLGVDDTLRLTLDGSVKMPYLRTATASSTYEPIISAGTSSQYWRGDKSWQTLDKSAVGLGNVDNTSDANKPVSTATQTALDGKQNALSGTGFVKISGTTISYDNSTYLTSEVDGSTTNEIELPSQSGQSGKVLSTNGSSPTWITVGAGTVTSVGLSMPSAFNVSNSPVTSSGTLTVTGTGTAAQFINGTGAVSNFPAVNNATAYSAGTVYTLTTTSAKVDFGTTDPVVTIPAAGTYIIFTNLKIEYAGLTTLLNTCNFKLRRTNNTAADISNASTSFSAVATLLTGTGGDVDIAPIIYTTSNNNDVIELWGNRQNGVGITGSINVGEASVIAVRIY